MRPKFVLVIFLYLDQYYHFLIFVQLILLLNLLIVQLILFVLSSRFILSLIEKQLVHIYVYILKIFVVCEEPLFYAIERPALTKPLI